MSWKQPKYSQQHKLRILPALHVLFFWNYKSMQ